ncbi:GTPase-associated system all-helical protein GASH [Psychrobacter sp.]|uniref:GTPase-associated system all-helical protein GASH n=1 Tax=Psychrobacter sp. TaxID=56811 RepID=UPI003C753B08
MENRVLIQFLSKQLIDLNSSDEKLSKLVSTSNELSNTLKKIPSKALSYILVVLDPEESVEQPVVQEVLSILEGNWATYANTFFDKPIQVVRALLLQALANGAEENQQIAIAFALITRNILPHIEVGRESEIWNNLIKTIELKLNNQAEEEWATPPKIIVEDFSYSSSKSTKLIFPKVTLDREFLQSGIEEASGPNRANGEATGANPHLPTQGATWVNEFAPLLTTAIATDIENAFAEIEMDVSKPLKYLSVAVGNHIDSALNSVSSAILGLQRRTSLIWWKESFYSPSAYCSYREMPLNIAATVMAFDLFSQVPTCSPASVTAFLNEIVSSLSVDTITESIELADLISEVQSSEYTNSFCMYLDDIFSDFQGEGLLLPLLKHNSRTSKPNQEGFNNLKGLGSNTEKSISDWASWIFRELQATRAVLQGGDTGD